MTKRRATRNLKKTTEAQTDTASSKILNDQKSGPSSISSLEVDSSNCGMIKINADTVPSELKKLKQWVMWKREIRNGKPTKVPYTVNNVPAKADDPATWNSFDACLQALSSTGKYHFSGIGFEFSKTSGITGIDIDHCLNPDTGLIEDWAAEKVRQFNSYAEVSPSGEGLHIFVTGVKRWGVASTATLNCMTLVGFSR